jgi:hypothetical protein
MIHDTRKRDLLEDAAALEKQGRALDALALLRAAPRSEGDASLERQLVRLRHMAFHEFVRARGDAAVSVPQPRPREEARAPIQPPPDTPPDGLTPARLREQLYRHGCVLVRGLVPLPAIASLVEAIDQAFAAFDAHVKKLPAPPGWFDPILEIDGGMLSRTWVRGAGGVLAADSPRALEIMLETYARLGLERLITAYFGERPAISADKTTLRRAEPAAAAEWHQDGRFLGTDIRSLNVWIALTDCGIDAPGLDIVPVYPDRILETGTGEATFDWTIDHDAVVREYGVEAIWHPVFRAGDALLFDHMLVHRTACGPSMTRSRHALESWFFAPSAYPGTQTPLLV